MATVVLGWELGEGLGHVQKLAHVARPLQAEGHTPVFVLLNTIEPRPLLRDTGIPILQAPVCPAPTGGALPSNLVDILALHGWDSVDRLLPLVLAWQRLLELLQPRLIVGDFSPTLALAAFEKVPMVLLGSWFTLPPSCNGRFPHLTPGQAPLASHEHVFAVVQEVQRRRGASLPGSLPEILDRADRFPIVLPELDGHASLRSEPTWCPLEALPPATAPASPHFFAYLTADFPEVEAVLTELALTGCTGTVYLRGAGSEVRERLRLQGLEVLDEPASAASMLTRSSVIIHHGGLGTAQLALAAGRPQIVLPRQLEQFTTAQILRKLGVALRLVGSLTPRSVARALHEMLHEPRFADTARSLGQRIQNRPCQDTLTAILECCRRHLA